MNKLLIILILSSFSICTEGQSITKSYPIEAGMSEQRLSRIVPHFQEYVDKGKIAGMQTLVYRKGKTVHFESIGYADLEKKSKLEDGSIFRIYSMSKPIVSVALMMLFEEGKVQLNDPVSKYIPSFKNLVVMDESGATTPAKNEMLVLDLLRHTSGLGYGWGRGIVDSLYRVAGSRSATNLEEYAQNVSTLPLYNQPGEKWRYSISTDILGRVIEVISGQSLDVFLKNRIFKPLGMIDSFFEVPKSKHNRFTNCYRRDQDGNLQVQDDALTSRFSNDVTRFSGGGGLLSTTHDYLRFCRMMLNGGELDGARLLSPKTVELMTISHTEGIGHGGGMGYDLQHAFGFGLGFSVTKNLAKTRSLGSKGSYSWGGAAGTTFIIDPKEELIYIQMIQLMPYSHLNHQQEFKNLVYQAIVD